MTTPAVLVPDLVLAHGHACQRSGRGKGCQLIRWSRCRTCGWWGELWDGDQPPLSDAEHACDPDAAARYQQTRRTGG
ncbi:hypothetical protein [Micromonospora sp. WMMD1082]|uniref:hypothetical protein n=1 Tax=Micromonospora sp. WMMD1082 TaxID=3016104 RepID=UPI002416B2A1|nr:hypothetical protein [Micromonospora sp. WMMD1082]MDG4796913.1 hypothetical protein [Micromonospora sp. WMMD1082]